MRHLPTTAVQIALVMILGNVVHAETYRVGPTRELKGLKEIVPRLAAGDVVEVDPGVYREVHKLKANGTKDKPVVIRGVRGKERPVFDAAGLDVSGKGPIPRAIFQIEGAYWVLERLELKNARNGSTAAGVRLNGSTNAVIRDCVIHHCDLGVFGDDKETATIEACDVHSNSTDQWKGYAHNFYMHGNRVVVRNCHIHDCPYGQNFKTRAHYNELWYNWIADSDEGEVGPVDERAGRPANTGTPNSNVLLVGNVIVSKPDRTGNPSKYILFGSELKDGSSGHDGTLYLFNNTLLAGSEKIIFIQLADPKARLVAANNIFLGSKRILETPVRPLMVSGSNNWVETDARVPAEFVKTIRGPAPGLVDMARRDVRLKPDSPCLDAGTADLEYTDGDGVRHKLLVQSSYQPHLTVTPRKAVGQIDIGAYELGAPPLSPGSGGAADRPAGATVSIGQHVFTVEVAADLAVRERGLSGRRELPPDRGMLFVYPAARSPEQFGFWMKGCLIDLDIAFISSRGQIVTIHTMKAEPPDRPDDRLAVYRPTAPAQFALEVPAGEFARWGIKVGDGVEFSAEVRRAVSRTR